MWIARTGPTGDTVRDRLGQAPLRGNDDRRPAGLRLQRHQPERLALREVGRDMSGAVQHAQLLIADADADRQLDAELPRERRQPGCFCRPRARCDDHHGSSGPSGCDAAQDQIVALCRQQHSDREHERPVTPVRSGVRERLGDPQPQDGRLAAVDASDLIRGVARVSGDPRGASRGRAIAPRDLPVERGVQRSCPEVPACSTVLLGINAPWLVAEIERGRR